METKFQLTPNMRASLEAMKGGKAMTHDAIAKVTGRSKGNRLRELTGAKLIDTSEQEGVRGYVYKITPAGLKALAAPIPTPEPKPAKPAPKEEPKAEAKPLPESQADVAARIEKTKAPAKPKAPKKPKADAK